MHIPPSNAKKFANADSFHFELSKGRKLTVLWVEWKLAHCGLMTPYGDTNLGQHPGVNTGTGNGLLPDSTKPLPEPVLTYLQ